MHMQLETNCNLTSRCCSILHTVLLKRGMIGETLQTNMFFSKKKKDLLCTEKGKKKTQTEREQFYDRAD